MALACEGCLHWKTNLGIFLFGSDGGHRDVLHFTLVSSTPRDQ
ncbi:hypothetical protein RISK_003673 [Rhodopirellula islandica]|uniref:Uncharacterized protein n=1 Tax=Rhodopirellula islandica TaxID=595434 RepID=A0A0J1BBT6_RHOIS|nr:hypothetical protein RISK_003673 [Rhodopirellula islandica]